ncbi:MAG: hypothetical protein FWH03_05415 [Firmicutes bacterium]|nr:hypothetical protein [Bacillota bacterium]
MEKEKMYLVKLDGTRDGDHYSAIGFIMWSDKKHAKKYTLAQAEKLIAEIPEHMGKGVLVEAEAE